MPAPMKRTACEDAVGKAFMPSVPMFHAISGGTDESVPYAHTCGGAKKAPLCKGGSREAGGGLSLPAAGATNILWSIPLFHRATTKCAKNAKFTATNRPFYRKFCQKTAQKQPNTKRLFSPIMNMYLNEKVFTFTLFYGKSGQNRPRIRRFFAKA